MSERKWYQFWRGNEAKPSNVSARVSTKKEGFRAVAGVPDVMRDTERLQKDSNYDNEFDMYDLMLKLDPELNGAVRAVSLTANNYEINYAKGKNATIRNAIKELVEDTLDFDDILITALRNLMVYGNDINKIVGRQGVGITNLQSLPVKQITIVDERGGLEKSFNADEENPIIHPDQYILREQKYNTVAIPAEELRG